MTDDGSGDSRFAFLYRSESGRIDARTWLRAVAPLLALFTLATGVWLFLRPYAQRGLDQRTLLDPLTLAANGVTLICIFGLILLTICWVNLSAKRFRDAAWAPSLGLASVLPLVALLDGALHWLQPRMTDALPRGAVYAGDAAVLGALVWTVLVCGGFLRKR